MSETRTADGERPARGALAPVRALALALILATAAGPALADAGLPIAFQASGARGVARGSWLQSALIFLVITGLGGYVWYFGLFPRLLRKARPSWPLDAWRLSSYGAWLTTCGAAWFFKRPLLGVLTPVLRGVVNDNLIAFSMELILLPLLALLGLLVIWNFRREATSRARPG